MLVRVSTGKPALLCTSERGFKWACDHSGGPVTDRASFFYNPHSASWAFSLRHNSCIDGHLETHAGKGARVSRYAEAKAFTSAAWKAYQHRR